MKRETEKVFRKIQRRLMLKNTIGMTYDNIRGLFTIPGLFFNVDIGGWGFSDRPVDKSSTMDARYIYIARNRVRRLIKLKIDRQAIKDVVKVLMGGTVCMLNTPHGSMVYVVTPAGILWIDRPPIYAINPDHKQTIYTTLMSNTNEYYKAARRHLLR